MKKILVTGCAGFIGAFVTKKLLDSNFSVIGIDNLNSYYDVQLKKDRLKFICEKSENPNFTFFQKDISNLEEINNIFARSRPHYVIHLAAQAGVRYSISNPHLYISSNIVGFSNIIECSKLYDIEHFIYASSSSVYGGRSSTPFYESDTVDLPISLYAATKKSNELMAHTYSHLFNLSTTGLRFFSVYGPWGRPDMATFIFTDAILKGKPIPLFNHGNLWRDFTYIDDIVESVVRIVEKFSLQQHSTKSSNFTPYNIFNIGNSNPIKVIDFLIALENAIGEKAIYNPLPMQPGDVPITYSDTSKIQKFINFIPNTSINFGLKNFVTWYRDYFKI